MPAVHRHALGDLLVHDHIDLDALLGLALEDLVEAPLLVVVGWSAHEQLWGQPPVRDVDGLLGLVQRGRDRPAVVPAVNVPLDQVAVALGEKGLETMRFAYFCALLVAGLLMFLVMAVLGIELFPEVLVNVNALLTFSCLFVPCQ